jgi:VanZ family protein
MNFDSKTFLNYFLLIFWMGVIFYLSNQPDLKSGFESRLDFILRKIDTDFFGLAGV